MSNEKNPKDAHIDMMNSQKLFSKLCLGIAGLETAEFQRLRLWLTIHTTIDDWRALMET